MVILEELSRLTPENYFSNEDKNMIQNQHQYQVTQNKLKDLERGFNRLEEIKDNLHPRQYLGRKNSLVININTLN